MPTVLQASISRVPAGAETALPSTVTFTSFGASAMNNWDQLRVCTRRHTNASLVDDDLHLARDASEFARTGAGYDNNVQVWFTVIHCRIMLQNETAAVRVQRARYLFDRNISTGTSGTARTQHLTLTGAYQIAVELLVYRESSQRLVLLTIGGKRTDLHVEASPGMMCYG